MNQHKDEDFDIKDNKVFSVLCESKGIAVEVEHLMSSEFSITNKEQEDDEIYVGNGAMDSTRYVYLLSIG